MIPNDFNKYISIQEMLLSWIMFKYIYLWQIQRIIRDIGNSAYLIFVIFFTRAKFLENKIYTEKRQFFALNL